MANNTIYPFGPGGEIPGGTGVVNDLTTGGVDSALSAEQGKVLGNRTDLLADGGYMPDFSGYTERTYTGARLRVKDGHSLGIKAWSNMAQSKQGMAIYGDILVRMAKTSTSTTHVVYQIAADGTLTQLATFTLSGTGHSNSLQFAPLLETGQTLPYLYVSDTTTNCYVLSFDSSYQATIVQTITISGSASQILRGDDGYVWSSLPGTGNHRRLRKYRRVAVSEGDVTLTDSDKLDEWETLEAFPSSTYTMQGWKIKEGRLWLLYGDTNAGDQRGMCVYDTATHAMIARIDLTNYGAIEYEDLDFWDGAVILATDKKNSYILRT